MWDVLTTKAEEVLRDILSHKNENGSFDTKYWSEKFDTFSFEEDNLCRSCFKELSENDLVQTRWADNCPYIISVTSKGLSYFERKTQAEKEAKKEKHSSRWHDVWVAAIGAVFGGIVTFVLFKLFGIG